MPLKQPAEVFVLIGVYNELKPPKKQSGLNPGHFTIRLRCKPLQLKIFLEGKF